MTRSEHARKMLSRLADKFGKESTRLFTDHGEDPVHDFRVSIRRLSQALRVFGDWLPARQGRKLRKSIKPAMDAAAMVRDLDVGMELLLKEGLPEEHAYVGRLRSERERSALGLLGQVYLLRAAEIPESWTPAFAQLANTSYSAQDASADDAGLTARSTLPSEASEFFKAGRKTVLRGESPHRLHAFRLTAKRFRYTLEIYRDFYGPVFEIRLNQVREIQSLLGKRQDCAVMADRLRPLAAIDAHLQLVLREIENKGARAENEFREYWHKVFDGPDEELRWTRYLGRRPAARSTANPIQ